MAKSSTDTTIGRILINDSFDEKCNSILWIICDYFSLSEKRDKHYCSPSFSLIGDEWHLEICPNGESEKDSVGWTGLYLWKEKPFTGYGLKMIKFTFRIMTSTGCIYKSFNGEKTFQGNETGFGIQKFLQLSEIRREISTLAPDNRLKIYCKIIRKRKSEDESASESTEEYSSCEGETDEDTKATLKQNALESREKSSSSEGESDEGAKAILKQNELESREESSSSEDESDKDTHSKNNAPDCVLRHYRTIPKSGGFQFMRAVSDELKVKFREEHSKSEGKPDEDTKAILKQNEPKLIFREGSSRSEGKSDEDTKTTLRPNELKMNFREDRSRSEDKSDEDTETTFKQNELKLRFREERSRSEVKSDKDTKRILKQTDDLELKSEKASSSSEDEFDEEIEKSGLEIFCQDIKNMFLSERLCDVKIRIEDKEFPAHKTILAARSPVFFAMFEHETEEKNKIVVEISDCKTDVFREFLHYLYTGKVEEVSQMHEVYMLADKYAVKQLKKDCVPIMMRGVSADNFCAVMSLAVKYDESELLKKTSDYFVKNAKSILQSVQWQVFMADNAKVANELFLKTMSH